MKKLAITSACLALLAVTGTANAYQAEVGVGYERLEPNHGDSADAYSIGGTYYFSPVQVKNAPLNEAAFLGRASNVKANVAYEDRNNDSVASYGTGIEYYVPNTNFYLSGDVAYHNIREQTPAGKDRTDLMSYAAEVGYLPINGLLVAVGAKSYDDQNDNSTDGTVRVKYSTEIAGKDIALEASSGFGDFEEYRFAADYYINKTFNVGADYYKNDFTGQNEAGISAKKFFTQRASLEGRVGFGDHYNTYGIAGKYRF